MSNLAALTEQEEDDVRRLVALHQYAVPIFLGVLAVGAWFWLRKKA